ncbi:MAG TPA: M67 family metallopeptidase [Solirubrobacterales bacterium]|nr:M67 family metallopeptidase [Solirubrobacterales bacterium]
MRFPQSLIDEIVAHAREDLPNECCGMVGGKDGEARTVYRARNGFESPLRFEVDARDLFRIVQKEMPQRDEELVAIYHSHTKSPAYPSQTDVNMAKNSWPEAMWIIVSLENAEQPDVKAYWLKELTISEAELAVE